MRKYTDLERRYWIKKKGLTTVIEELKQRLKAKREKIKRYQQRKHQYRQNRTFRTDQKRIYQEMNGNVTQEGVKPDVEESKRLWSGIWDIDKKHNENAEWLGEMKQESREVQEDIATTREMKI